MKKNIPQKLFYIISALVIIIACSKAQDINNLQSEPTPADTNNISTRQDSLKGEIIPCQEIVIKCDQVHPAENIIRNEKEYQALLNIRSLHPDCENYKLPEIDFNKYTLLGVYVSSGGCKAPTFEHSIIKLPDGNYQFNVKVKEYGGCLRLWSFEIWCLIPKIRQDQNVEFNLETEYREIEIKHKKQ